MQYKATVLREVFKIKSVISIHYFEYGSKFSFKGESHDFWEFIYVDKGQIEVRADKKSYILNQGEILFHKPNEFHDLSANGTIAPNLVVISFNCSGKYINFFKNKVLNLDNFERNILASIIREAKRAFDEKSIGNPLSIKLNKINKPFFGSEQMIKILIEQLLIALYRNNNAKNRINISVNKSRMDLNIIDDVIQFLEQNLGNKITFKDVVKYANISETGLKTLFKKQMGMGVMQYFNTLKIEKAKMIIREDNYNFTQISVMLGYDSIHYFSKQFKNICKMSPTEYSKSVKSLIS